MAGSHNTPYRRHESNASQTSGQPTPPLRRPSIDRTSDHGLSSGNSSASQTQSITAPARPRRQNIRQLTRTTNRHTNFRDLAHRRARRGDRYQQFSSSSSSYSPTSRLSGRDSSIPHDSHSAYNGSEISSSASERSHNTIQQAERGSSNESIVDLVPHEFERNHSERRQRNRARRHRNRATRNQAEAGCCIVM
ncbi:MAG: hypothetical protein MK137_01970 [Rickettsiales bacterium]|nr:hypothetical protein [Rickettsiales bacterium]